MAIPSQACRWPRGKVIGTSRWDSMEKPGRTMQILTRQQFALLERFFRALKQDSGDNGPQITLGVRELKHKDILRARALRRRSLVWGLEYRDERYERYVISRKGYAYYLEHMGDFGWVRKIDLDPSISKHQPPTIITPPFRGGRSSS